MSKEHPRHYLKAPKGVTNLQEDEAVPAFLISQEGTTLEQRNGRKGIFPAIRDERGEKHVVLLRPVLGTLLSESSSA